MAYIEIHCLWQPMGYLEGHTLTQNNDDQLEGFFSIVFSYEKFLRLKKKKNNNLHLPRSNGMVIKEIYSRKMQQTRPLHTVSTNISLSFFFFLCLEKSASMTI